MIATAVILATVFGVPMVINFFDYMNENRSNQNKFE